MTGQRALPVAQWSAEDQRLWRRAFALGSVRETSGLAVHWRTASKLKIEREYGRWLTFCQVTKVPIDCGLPAERVSPEQIAAYVTSLQRRVCSVTVASYIIGLSEALRVMQPGHKRTFLKGVISQLKQQARPSRDYAGRMCAPSELYDAGLRRMDRYQDEESVDDIVNFSGGLMISFAAAKALRLRNLTHMPIGVNLISLPDGRYEVRAPAAETKTHTAIRAVLPSSLTRYIDTWLYDKRPRLLAGRLSDAMWLGPTGLPLDGDAIYRQFCKATLAELGKHINPHLARRIVATGVAIAAPELVNIIPSLLDHSSDRSEKDTYNMADRLTASSRMLELLEPRRRAAINNLVRKAGK